MNVKTVNKTYQVHAVEHSFYLFDECNFLLIVEFEHLHLERCLNLLRCGCFFILS